MREIILSKNQVVDAAGAVNEAARKAFNDTDRKLYTPDTSALPRPSYKDYQATGVTGLTALHTLPNLRIMAAVKTSDGRQIYLPGTVLPSSPGRVIIGCLQLDGRSDRSRLNVPFTNTQQALLDNVYTMQTSDPGRTGHQLNAAEITHASLVAASTSPLNIHPNVHSLARDGTFAARFGSQGAMDIRVGHQIRSVRPVILPAAQASEVLVFESHQMPAGSDPMNLSLTAGQVAVGMVLAATESRGVTPNLVQNLTTMAGG